MQTKETPRLRTQPEALKYRSKRLAQGTSRFGSTARLGGGTRREISKHSAAKKKSPARARLSEDIALRRVATEDRGSEFTGGRQKARDTLQAWLYP